MKNVSSVQERCLMAYDARHAKKLGIGVVLPSPRMYKNQLLLLKKANGNV